MKKIIKTLLLGAVVALAPVVQAGSAFADGEHFVLISHSPDSDSWWNTVKNAIKLAGKQMDVKVDYRNPTTGDIGDMARIIQQVTASKPDGIITTLADFDVLKGPIKAATDQGIPVIIMNTGTADEAKAVGALMYIGQPEYEAGLAAGKRAKSEGVTHFLCVNHTIQQPTVAERCKGYADGLGVKLGDSMMDSGTDPAEIKNKVLAYLSAHPEVNGILTIGPTSADPTIAAVKEKGIAGKIHFGTFDIDAEIVKAIKDGTIKWAIDQQPFLQGYLPVVLLTNYLRYGVLPGNNINSGPGFVTKDSLGKVEKFAGVYR